jgi:hypothetical protein
MRLVQQDPHQLGDLHGWMGVVELNSYFLRKRAPIRVRAPETPHQVGQRAGDEKIFLDDVTLMTDSL